PETQVVLERLTSPFAPLLLAAARGELADGTELTWSEQAAVTVVLACAGYPAAVRTGDPITGLETCEALGAHVIHAGTAVVDDTLVSAGGRVLSVVATGEDREQARSRALAATEQIVLDGSHHRTDIARRAASGALGTSGETAGASPRPWSRPHSWRAGTTSSPGRSASCTSRRASPRRRHRRCWWSPPTASAPTTTPCSPASRTRAGCSPGSACSGSSSWRTSCPTTCSRPPTCRRPWPGARCAAAAWTWSSSSASPAVT